MKRERLCTWRPSKRFWSTVACSKSSMFWNVRRCAPGHLVGRHAVNVLTVEDHAPPSDRKSGRRG